MQANIWLDAAQQLILTGLVVPVAVAIVTAFLFYRINK